MLLTYALHVQEFEEGHPLAGHAAVLNDPGPPSRPEAVGRLVTLGRNLGLHEESIHDSVQLLDRLTLMGVHVQHVRSPHVLAAIALISAGQGGVLKYMLAYTHECMRACMCGHTQTHKHTRGDRRIARENAAGGETDTHTPMHTHTDTCAHTRTHTHTQRERGAGERGRGRVRKGRGNTRSWIYMRNDSMPEWLGPHDDRPGRLARNHWG
jgi:hypothetical protein